MNIYIRSTLYCLIVLSFAVTMAACIDKLIIDSTYTVTFNSNGGSEIASQEVEKGGKVTEPESPTKENGTFEGWYTDDGTFQQQFDFTTTITENITLYANWKRDESSPTVFTVTFNSNGGSDITPQEVKHGSSITAPDNVLHSCYTTILGWYTDNTFTAKFNVDTDSITEDTTLFAQWDENTSNTGETPIASQAIYQICNWKQLQWIAKDPERLDDDYILVKDIVLPNAGEDDLPVLGFIPIGHDVNPNNSNDAKNYEGTPFSGTLDGNNKTISNLFINALDINWTGSGTLIPNITLDDDFIGLFGQINRTESDPAVKNLTIMLAPGTQDNPSINAQSYTGGLTGSIIKGVIENVAVKGGYIKGNEFVGGFAGQIANSSVTGYVTGNIQLIHDTNANYAGGFAGQIANSSITGYATSNVTVISNTNVNYAGGFAGQIVNSSITGYATGNVQLTDTATSVKYVGGFTGLIANSSVTGYSIGKIPNLSDTAGELDNTGGFAGHIDSNVGGFAYWDMENSGYNQSPLENIIGISSTKNIVFNFNGYVDKGSNSDKDNNIFDNNVFIEQFDVMNGANTTWPKLKTAIFVLPQPTIRYSDGTGITIVFP